MLLPTENGRLARRTYGDDLHRMMDDWSRTWGASIIQGDTVGVMIDAYLGQLAQRRARGEIAETTERDYQKHAATLRQVFGAVQLRAVDTPMLVRWREIAAARSPVQFNRARTVLMAVFKVACERGLADRNPVEHLGRMKERPRDRYVTNDEVNALLRHAPRPVQAATILAVSAGLRQGDILALHWQAFGDDGLTVAPSKTSGRTRKKIHVPWSPGLRLACELARSKVAGIDGHWLRRRDGKRYTSDGFRTLFHRAMQAAIEADGIKTFTFHDLRAKAGTDAEDWRLLGHLDQRTHSRVYDRKPITAKAAR